MNKFKIQNLTLIISISGIQSKKNVVVMLLRKLIVYK